MSQHMNRSQHASTDTRFDESGCRDHTAPVSQHAVGRESHNNFALSPGCSCLAPRLATGSSSLHTCFPARLIQGRSAWCSRVSRPRSPRVHRCEPTFPSTPQRSTRLPQHRRSRRGRPASSPKRQPTNNSDCCFFRQCLRAMPTHPSLDQVFLQTPLLASLVATTQCEASISLRLAEHVGRDGVLADAPRAAAKTPGTLEWRCHDETNANSNILPAAASTTNTSTRITHTPRPAT